MALQNFIEENQAMLLSMTRAKVAGRGGAARPAALERHGVPLFLNQLRGALVDEASHDPSQQADPNPPTNSDIADSAALHGQDLFAMGLSIDQVVHGYGDVCQAVTELAVKRDAPISVAEFHTLNRCLDNAIASAVSVWSKTALSATDVSNTLRCLLDGAIVAFDLLSTGQVAAGGATGHVLGRSLREMQTILGTSSDLRPGGNGAPGA